MLLKIPVYKYRGETPYQCIQRIKRCYPEYINSSITYAGRLDPAAEGLLVLLVDGAIDEKAQILAYHKTYLCDILIGVATDTYDVVGAITHTKPMNRFPNTTIVDHAKAPFIGQFDQAYPPYSSKTLHGVPLWKHAREGTITDTALLPKHRVHVFDLVILSFSSLSGNEVATSALTVLNSIKGDFRQSELREGWSVFRDTYHAVRFPVVRAEITCSSGTYIRSIAHDMGPRIGAPSLCFCLQRTHVGPWALSSKH